MASIDKRAGRYRVRYRDPSGASRSRTFRRKADAERFAREVEVDMDRGQWIDPRGADIALEQWVETFLTFAQSLSPTTVQTYRRDLDRYILPRFGSVRLARLSPEEIEIWLNDELAKGLAPSSVHRHYRTLRRVLQTAVEKDRLLTNPCDRVRPPKVPKTAMTVLTWEQATALAEAHTERYRALIYVAVDTGMRWSEVVGLRRRSVDVERRKIRVVEQLVQLDDGSRVRRQPKTDSGPAQSRSRPPSRPCSATTSTASWRPTPIRWCSPTAPASRCRTRASRPITSAGPSSSPACRAGSTTSGTRASPWRSPRAPTPRRSRSGWATARSPSPSTATAISSPSSTKPSPRRSTPVSGRWPGSGVADLNVILSSARTTAQNSIWNVG